MLQLASYFTLLNILYILSKANSCHSNPKCSWNDTIDACDSAEDVKKARQCNYERVPECERHRLCKYCFGAELPKCIPLSEVTAACNCTKETVGTFEGVCKITELVSDTEEKESSVAAQGYFPYYKQEGAEDYVPSFTTVESISLLSREQCHLQDFENGLIIAYYDSRRACLSYGIQYSDDNSQCSGYTSKGKPYRCLTMDCITCPTRCEALGAACSSSPIDSQQKSSLLISLLIAGIAVVLITLSIFAFRQFVIKRLHLFSFSLTCI